MYRISNFFLTTIFLSYLFSYCPGGEDICLSLDGGNLNYDSTDEISLFLKKFPNTKIGFTKGSKLNFKVTNKDDLFIARSISDKC